MSAFYPTLLNPLQAPKRKAFISYYHADDQAYNDALEKHYGHLFISKSVDPGNITAELSTAYIKHLIQDGYISDCTILIVLVSPHTYGRKHVDWEISAALNYKIGDGYAGLVGFLLPTFPMLTPNTYDRNKIPARLSDNVHSGYASIYTWTDAYGSGARFSEVLEKSYSTRSKLSEKIDNSRSQMQRNTSPYAPTLLGGG